MLSRVLFAGLLISLGALSVRPAAAADDWLPVSPDDLKMTSEPLAPGAPAIYLYRQVDRDDGESFERTYLRIKILTQAGLKYANVEIPFSKESESIRNVQARTIRPDGSTLKFDGTIYEKPLVKSGRSSYMAKTFTLPEAEVGSILEYRFDRLLPRGWVYDSRWVLSEDLFTRVARFTLEPAHNFSLIWSWPRGLPPGTEEPKADHGRVHLEAHNVQAVVTEEYMPPDAEVRLRVDFVYDERRIARTDPVEFWKEYDQQLNQVIEHFCDRRKAMEKAVAQLTATGDSPETRLRKLYARMQQIHNLTFESDSEREARHEDSAAIKNVEDVWNRGYGTAEEISWLFMALARAAQLDAHAVMIATRDRYFFNHRAMNPTELNTGIVLVRLGDRDLFLDPGVPFTPFGLLPWYETQVDGLKLDKDAGTWLLTPTPVPSDSRIIRHGTFRLDNGVLDGKVTVTYTGIEAAWRRQNEQYEDEVARRKFLQGDLESCVPTGINAKLTNTVDWNGWDTPLVAEFEVQIPGWSTPAGHRALLPLGVFGGAEKHAFEAATRVQQIYFDFLSQHSDDVTIDIADPWTLESLPATAALDLKGLVFKESAEAQGSSLHATRDLTVNAVLIDPKSYDSVHQFYQRVRAADESQVVLSYGRPSRR